MKDVIYLLVLTGLLIAIDKVAFRGHYTTVIWEAVRGLT